MAEHLPSHQTVDKEQHQQLELCFWSSDECKSPINLHGSLSINSDARGSTFLTENEDTLSVRFYLLETNVLEEVVDLRLKSQEDHLRRLKNKNYIS